MQCRADEAGGECPSGEWASTALDVRSSLDPAEHSTHRIVRRTRSREQRPLPA